VVNLPRHPASVLVRLYEGGIAAVEPSPAVHQGIAALAIPADTWIRILALGKASVPMANAAVEALQARGLRVREGLVVSHAPAALRAPELLLVTGDHPLPGPRSQRAAQAIDRFARDGRPGDLVIVLLSGGTSSLIAAPVEGLAEADLLALHTQLLTLGLPIGATNRLRRRCSRWGAGRLGVALAPARVELLAMSDVPGDALADIGSGPCSPDPDSALGLRTWLQGSGLWPELPAGVRRLIDATAAGLAHETPQAGDPRLASVAARIIASNREAVAGVLLRAALLGVEAEAAGEPLSGDAAGMGRRIAAQLLAARSGEGPACLIWGGETTVRVTTPDAGLGGRSQELALAAAEVLAEAEGDYPALLAAGTDGRDGATEAAGGFADPATWRRIIAAGRSPSIDLARHDSHAALGCARALLVTGPSGTNVMDLVIALVR